MHSETYMEKAQRNEAKKQVITAELRKLNPYRLENDLRIGRLHGVAASRVRQIRRSLKIRAYAHPKYIRLASKIEEIKALVERGATYRDIARHFKLPVGKERMRQLLKQLGLRSHRNNHDPEEYLRKIGLSKEAQAALKKITSAKTAVKSKTLRCYLESLGMGYDQFRTYCRRRGISAHIGRRKRILRVNCTCAQCGGPFKRKENRLRGSSGKVFCTSACRCLYAKEHPWFWGGRTPGSKRTASGTMGAFTGEAGSQ